MTKQNQKMIMKNRIYSAAWKYVRALNGEGDFEYSRAKLFEAIDSAQETEILTEAETSKVLKTVHDEYQKECEIEEEEVVC